MDWFTMDVPDDRLRSMTSLGLAHIGDAVYELMVRTRLACAGGSTAKGLHRAAVRLVAAPAQARFAERILPALTEEEAAVFRRGRNARVNSVPQRASVGEYHTATALEALFGWLYLKGRRDRLSELFDMMMEGE